MIETQSSVVSHWKDAAGSAVAAVSGDQQDISGQVKELSSVSSELSTKLAATEEKVEVIQTKMANMVSMLLKRIKILEEKSGVGSASIKI